MTEHKDGGPAFPHMKYARPIVDGFTVTQTITDGGMSLRDYFAAHAMNAIIGRIPPARTAYREIDIPNKIALVAFSIADAMLAEREKVTP